MEKAFTKVEELAGTIKEYVDVRMEAVKLNAAEKSSSVIANVMAGIVVAIVFLFFLGLASMSLAYGIGDWIGRTWAGFLVVAGLYLLIGIIVWSARSRLIQLPVVNAMIQQLFKNDEED